MIKRKALFLLLACSLLFAVSFHVQAATKKGWDATKTSYYVKKSGKLVKATGLTKIGSELYYFNKNGIVVKSKWVKNLKDGSKKYTFYFGKDGKAYKAPRVSEWFTTTAVKRFKIGSKYYAFDTNAHMVTGYAVATDEKLYFFDSKGVYNSAKTTAARKLTKVGKTSKTLLADVKKLLGKPVRLTVTDSCNYFDVKPGKDVTEGVTYSGYLLTYERYDVSITRNNKTKIYHMDGPTAIIDD